MGTVHPLFPANDPATVATVHPIRPAYLNPTPAPKATWSFTPAQRRELSCLTAAASARDEDFKRMWMNKADQAALTIKMPPVLTDTRLDDGDEPDARRLYHSANTVALEAPGYDATAKPARYTIWVMIAVTALLAIAVTDMGWLPTFGG